MVEIILLILKIFGIVLLSVLGLLLLILLTVLLVPFRYGADVSKYENVEASVFASWLFRAVSFRFYLTGEKKGTELKLFGIRLGGRGKKTVDIDEVPTDPDNIPTDPDDIPEETIQPDASEESGENTSAADSEKTENAAGPAAEESDIHHVEDSEDDAADRTSGDESVQDRAGDEKKPADERIDDFLDMLGSKYLIFENKLDDIEDKAGFITGEHAMREAGRALKNVGLIVHHILPHRLSGYLHLGMESPADTGMITAYYSAAAPVHHYTLALEPDFTQKIIEGEVSLGGRFFIGYIVWRALVIVVNRDVLYLVRNYKKYFRKSQEAHDGR